MAGETSITIIGNLTNDPELRFTPSGQAVANFTIASTPRTFNRQANGWEDGETLYLRASIWREAAENVAESLTKGMRVIAQGNLKSRTYETKEGEKRTVIEFEVQEIGPSLRYANAKVNRTQRNGQGQGPQGQDYAPAQGGYNQQNQGGWGNQPQGQWNGQQGGQQPPQQGGFGGGQQAQNQYATGGGFGGQQQPQGQQWPQTPLPQQDDPWATPGVSNSGGWGNGPQNEPPF